MPLSDRYYDSPFVTTRIGGNTEVPKGEGYFPDYGAIQQEYDEIANPSGSGFSFLDMVGEGLHHFTSSASMGMIGSGYTPWEDKSLSQKIGASIGEAAGFFVPMSWIGKGVRGVKAAVGLGSKAVARKTITSATQKITSKTARDAIQSGLKKGILSKYGKRNLYKYELGGQQLQRASKSLLEGTETSVRNSLRKAGVKIDSKMDDVIKA